MLTVGILVERAEAVAVLRCGWTEVEFQEYVREVYGTFLATRDALALWKDFCHLRAYLEWKANGGKPAARKDRDRLKATAEVAGM